MAKGVYRLSPLAEQDFEEIWRYTAQKWSREQADHYIHAMIAAFSELADGRISGRKTDIREGYFKHPVGSHFIFYKVSAEHIDIIRILHKRMDVERWLN